MRRPGGGGRGGRGGGGGGGADRLAGDGSSVVRHDARLQYWDTMGSSEHDRMRPLCVPQMDTFVVCFSPSSRRGGEDDGIGIDISRWRAQLEYHAPGTPWVLLGLRADLWDHLGEEEGFTATGARRRESRGAGEALARSLGAAAYLWSGAPPRRCAKPTCRTWSTGSRAPRSGGLSRRSCWRATGVWRRAWKQWLCPRQERR